MIFKDLVYYFQKYSYYLKQKLGQTQEKQPASEVLRRQNKESAKLLFIRNHGHSLQLGPSFCNTVIKVFFSSSSVMFAFNSFVNKVRLFSKFLSKKFKHPLNSKNSYFGFDLDAVFLNN